MESAGLTLPVVFGIAGLVAVFLAILRQVTVWNVIIGPLSPIMRWIVGVFGCVVVCVALYIYFHVPQPSNAQGAQSAPIPASSAAPAQAPPNPTVLQSQEPAKLSDDLVKRIKDKQEEYVGDSTGTQDYQCFNDIKLAAFRQAGRAAQAANELKSDPNFIRLVIQIRQLNPSDREKVFDTAVKTHRPTWAQMGIDPATAPKDELIKGQTDAGSEAERLIAQAIVALVRELCRIPVNQLQNLAS